MSNPCHDRFKTWISQTTGGDMLGEVVVAELYDAAQVELAALREELVRKDGVIEDMLESNSDMTTCLAAAEQRNAELESDKARINWLEEQPVDTLYLDDGRIIDIAGRIDLRVAIDNAIFAALKPTESGASEEDVQDGKTAFIRSNTKQGQNISMASMKARYEDKP